MLCRKTGQRWRTFIQMFTLFHRRRCTVTAVSCTRRSWLLVASQLARILLTKASWLRMLQQNISVNSSYQVCKYARERGQLPHKASLYAIAICKDQEELLCPFHRIYLSRLQHSSLNSPQVTTITVMGQRLQVAAWKVLMGLVQSKLLGYYGLWLKVQI